MGHVKTATQLENSIEDMSLQKPISQILGGRTHKLMRNLR